jgi:hypothetical protein
VARPRENWIVGNDPNLRIVSDKLQAATLGCGITALYFLSFSPMIGERVPGAFRQ